MFRSLGVDICIVDCKVYGSFPGPLYDLVGLQSPLSKTLVYRVLILGLFN